MARCLRPIRLRLTCGEGSRNLRRIVFGRDDEAPTEARIPSAASPTPGKCCCASCFMRCRWLPLSTSVLCWTFAVSAVCVAQEIPPGTLLPVALSSTIDSARAKAGDRVSAELAQEVTLPSGRRIARGTHLYGGITYVSTNAQGLARIRVGFDRLLVGKQDIPLSTSLRALASMLEVSEAQLPTNDVDDYGSSYADWNTRQVGGQAVYRGNGTLESSGQVVGRATWVGQVYAVPRANPRSPCAEDGTVPHTEQSLWVFSSDACGVYGVRGLKIEHAGRTDPVGSITLTAPGRVYIRGGSGWLLTVLSYGIGPGT